MGVGTMQTSTTASSNVAIGNSAGAGLTSGSNNTMVGFSAGSAITSGANNTAIGLSALSGNTTGVNNTALGYGSGNGITTGGNNTTIGTDAGGTLTTGGNNTVIGYDAEPTTATVSNQVTIGNSNISNFRIPGIGVDATDDRFKTTGHYAGSVPVTITADHTVADSTFWLINNKTGSTCTLTLPSAATWPGRILRVKNWQSYTVVSASSDVIPSGGGSAGTAILTADVGGFATLVSDGSNWIIFDYQCCQA
jgi:hypothetical protein